MNALDLAVIFGTLRLKADEERDDNIRVAYLREMERIKDQLIDTEIVEPKKDIPELRCQHCDAATGLDIETVQRSDHVVCPNCKRVIKDRYEDTRAEE